MPQETATRAWRFALRPTSAQAVVLERMNAAARALWNAATARQRAAEKLIRVGRIETLRDRLLELASRKKLTGAAVAKARRLTEAGGSIEADRIRGVDELVQLRRSKRGIRLRRLCRRRVAIEAAAAGTRAEYQRRGTALSAKAAEGLLAKFTDAAALYVSGERGRPRFKSAARADRAALQIQWQAPGSPVTLTRRRRHIVNLRGLGHPSLERVEVVLHRELPVGSRVKQVAVTHDGAQWHVVLSLAAPARDWALDLPAAGGCAAGLDPGRKTALTMSSADGEERGIITPPLFRDQRFLRRQRRLQRRLDRQRRANNPEAFDEAGRWIRGRGAPTTSRNMQRAQRRLGALQRHAANARKDCYHVAALGLLRRFDTVGVGTWRGRGAAPGVGKAKRAQNRKDLDNAPSLFAAILTDKAKRSLAPKTAVAVAEHGTTRTCGACGESTGPRGLEGLVVRRWTCSSCGVEHDRDFAAARAIARRAVQLAADAQSAQPTGDAPLRVRRTGRKASGGVAKAAPKTAQVAEQSASVPAPEEAKRREARPTSCPDRCERRGDDVESLTARAAAASEEQLGLFEIGRFSPAESPPSSRPLAEAPGLPALSGTARPCPRSG